MTVTDNVYFSRNGRWNYTDEVTAGDFMKLVMKICGRRVKVSQYEEGPAFTVQPTLGITGFLSMRYRGIRMEILGRHDISRWSK